MVKHIILWKLKEEHNTAAVKQGIKNGLEGLTGKIPGLVEIRVQTESLPSSNADVMLYSIFEDEASLKEYSADCLPERGDFAVVYSLLKRELKSEHEVFSLRSLQHLLSKNGISMPYQKLKAAVHIFNEMGLFKVKKLDAEREIYSFAYVRVNGKIDLEQSKILWTMRENYKRKSLYE